MGISIRAFVLGVGLCVVACGGSDKPAARCDDGEQNQDETDVDCGGSCGATCDNGAMCSDDSDCASSDCNGTCQPAPSCDDGMANGDESDVDCGGSCGGCDNGASCSQHSDCTSGGCNAAGACAAVHTVGGTVTGIMGAGLVLQNNSGDDLAIDQDGTFTFSTVVPEGDGYAVSILSSPATPAQRCAIAWNKGTVTGPVTDVAVDCEATPDNIADAFSLTEGIEVRFNSVDATEEVDEVYCDAAGTLWFTFNAPATGDYTAYATGSDHDTEVGWSEGLTGPLGDCNDDADDSYDAVDAQLSLAADQQRYLQLGLNSAGNVGTGSVGVVEVVPAADAFADALPLTVRQGAPTAVRGVSFSGSETSETDEPDGCGISTLNAASGWLTFTAPSSGMWMLESKSSIATDLAVYTGDTLSTLDMLHCANAYHIAVLVPLTAGEVYKLRVGAAEAGHTVIRAERTGPVMDASVVDMDGDGTSTSVGSYSDMRIIDGEPAIAYFDVTNEALRFAQRSGGTWSDELVDADGDGTSTAVGSGLSLAVLPSGEPAIAYYDATDQALRYAERSGNVWTDVLVDADGDGTSTHVGESLSLAIDTNGEPHIAYYDTTNGELRLATRASGVWADILIDADGDGGSTDVGQYPVLLATSEGLAVAYRDTTVDAVRYAQERSGVWTEALVYESPDAHSLYVGGLRTDSAGAPVIAVADDDQANHFLAWWNGSDWDIHWDFADRHVAELDFTCALPKLLIDPTDRAHVIWTDCNYAYSMAISTRELDGSWHVTDAVAQHLPPGSDEFTGGLGMDDTSQFGAVFLPDGRLAVTFQDATVNYLWYAESP